MLDKNDLQQIGELFDKHATKVFTKAFSEIWEHHFFPVFQDFYDRFDRIDSRFERLEGRIDSLTIRVGALEGRVGSLEDRINQLPTKYYLDEKIADLRAEWKSNRTKY